MSSTSDFLRRDQPTSNQIRVIERDGTRLLQQWRNKPGGYLHEYEWIDVAELAPLPSRVRQLRPKDSR
jgi:hypothetical protein